MAVVTSEQKALALDVAKFIVRVILTILFVTWVIVSALIFGGIKGAAKSKPPKQSG